MSNAINTVPFSRIERDLVRWLWQGRIALGKLTMVEGDGGIGKSSVLAWLAAGTSLGNLDGDLLGKSATVLIFSAEDGAGDTIRPRLEAQGADLDRVHGLDEQSNTGITLPQDIDRLHQLIVRTSAKLVVFDPIVSFLASNVPMNSDTAVRRALGPLKRVAGDTGAAIVFVRHLNAQRNAAAYRRGLGGSVLANIVRSVWVVATHPDDAGDLDGRRVIAHVKGNLDGRIVSSLEISRDESGRLIVGPEVAFTADELLQRRPVRSGARRATCAEAVTWLREFLAGREVSTNELNDEAATHDISERTLERARREVGVAHRRIAVTNADGTRTHMSVVRLPDFFVTEQPPEDPVTPPEPAAPTQALEPMLSSPASTVATPSGSRRPAAPLPDLDDATTRFSLIEIDVGRVDRLDKPASVNGHEATLPPDPTDRREMA